MAQTRRVKMHLRCAFILLVLSVVAESCDEEYYEKDNKCCSMCPPGTKMMENSPCDNPQCQDCADEQYQDSFTSEFKCIPQPYCNHNLNLQDNPEKSKIKRSPCVCVPNHHCSNEECNTCVRNTECQPGEQVVRMSTQMSDTVCEPCPNGTFSEDPSASTCKLWTICPSGFQQVVAGTATTDRVCEKPSRVSLYVVPVVLLCLLLASVVAAGYFLYKKRKTGSGSFIQKIQIWKFWRSKNIDVPAKDVVEVVVQQPVQPVNQPQEDTESLLGKQEGSLSPGISENGMPVIQDNSKSSLLSKAETEPESDYL